MTLIGKKQLHSDAHTTRFGKNMLAVQRRSDMVDLIKIPGLITS